MTGEGLHATTPQPTTAGRAEVRETHSSVVLLMGEYAYKIKKSVNLGFLDFRSEATRREDCRREVELNRRIAPDVYLDVIEIDGGDGHTYGDGVLMRRMPDALRLSTLVAQGLPVEKHLRALAELMVRFHASAERGPQIAAEGTAIGLRRRWVDNLRESEKFRGELLDPLLHDQISRLALAFVDGRAPFLAERAAQGLVVDGHGDLLAEDVFCLSDYPRVLDCLEFDDRLRWLDVLDDIAFLAMDLEHLGRPDLAEYFLAGYAEASGTPEPLSLRHHYIAYRAFVRAKVLCIQATQGRGDAAAEADHYARLALRHMLTGEVRLVLVGGGPGSGKSTLAGGLAKRFGAVLLSSDAIRQTLAPGGTDRYSAAAKAATYRELLAQARQALHHGLSVIADATWGDPAMRTLAEQAASATSSRLVELECRVPLTVAAERAQQRLDAGTDASEAGATVARTLAAQRSPWPSAVGVDTTASTAETLARAAAAIDGTKVHLR